MGRNGKGCINEVVALRAGWFITQVTSSSVSGLVLVTCQTPFPTFVITFFFSTADCEIYADGCLFASILCSCFQSGDKEKSLKQSLAC